MSRDVAGSYTLPGAVNPVVAGTTITDAWGNQTMNDVAAALTDSLSRSGKGGMTAQLKLADGTAAVPSISFSNETTTGFYRVAAGIMRLGVATAPLLEFTAANVTALQPFMAPTPATNINTTQVPTTAWVNTFYAALAAPTFTGVVTIPAGANITGYAKLAAPTFTGIVTIPAGAVISGYAPLASPTFTGTVILPPTGTGATEAVRKDYADGLSFAAALPLQAGNAGKFVTTNGTAASWVAITNILQPLSRRAFITASTTHTIPTGVTSARVYAVGAGAAGITNGQSGAGGGMGYGDIPVVAGDVLTITISAGSATVLKAGVTMAVGNPATGITAGTAGIGTAVTNGGAFNGGAGVVNAGAGGGSSGSPLGLGVAGSGGGATGQGGSGWGGASVATGGGGGVGGAGSAIYGGRGLTIPSIEPILFGLEGLGGASGLAGAVGGNGQPGAGGGFSTASASTLSGAGGGFGGGGGGTNAPSGIGGNGGFGGGGGGMVGTGGFGGAGGFGGGGGSTASGTGGAGGAPAVLIFY